MVRQEPAKLPFLSSNLSATLHPPFPVLYVVPTPIGNLGDITLRALDTLKKVERIFCEDTRKTKILLRHYEIETPLSSFHLFNEKRKEREILQLLEEGHEIALVSDAGTPCMQDPGEMLIAAVKEKNLPLTVLPGPSSIVQAYLSSGIFREKFQFIGFLPKKSGKRKKVLEASFLYDGTTIAFESPHRIRKTLEQIAEISPNRTISICREMTKRFEEIARGSAKELLLHFGERVVKGEISLVWEGA